MDFSLQYPTVAEADLHNAEVLTKRKRYFLSELRSQALVLSYLLSVFIYLRDGYLFLLILRLGTQWIASAHLPPEIQINATPELLQATLKKTLILILFALGYAMFTHLIFGGPREGRETHGGLTLQFIGDNVRLWGRPTLLMWDVSSLVCLLFYFLLEQNTDDSEVTSARHLTREDGDGYTGQVELLTLDPIKQLRQVLSYQITMANSIYLPGINRGTAPANADNNRQQTPQQQQQQQQPPPPVPGFFPSQAFV